MSNDFNASVVISTKESEAGIRQLDSASRDLDKTLQNLHKSLQNAQGDLDAVSKSMSAITRANAELVRSETARAKATVLAAKADGVAIDNAAKRSKIARENEIKDAKVAKLRQQTITGGKSGEATIARRDAESAARIANNTILTQGKLATETVRTTTALINQGTAATRAGSAAERAAAQTARLGDGSRKAASGTLALNDSLSNSRYLLYDVGQTYTVIALALQALPVATAAVAVAYERDFAQVIRTNAELAKTDGITSLREDLKQLATEIPLTFGEFSNIATIGGQLGIEGKNIESFTETVARFGAASNVSLDEASTAFGRLQNSYDPMRKDPDFFNKIGSAIAYVGVRSAATETEIIAVNNQISAAGAQFGFAADEIVGMSGALASVRIRPELARGAFQRIMLGLSRAADEGGEAFNTFGKYTGLAGDEAAKLFKTDPSAFFYKYIGGIKAAIAETGSVSAVLDDIGAKNVFDKQFILGLANGYDVFGKALNDSSKAFKEGSFLNESTDGVFNTVDAKIKRIANSIKNLADTVGKGSLEGLSGVADTVLGIVNAVDRFVQATPAMATGINLFLGLGSAIGILIAFKAAQAFVLAGLVGFQQVLGKGTLAAGLTAKGILQQVAVTMLMHKGVTQANAQALVLQAGAFKAMGIAAQTSAAQVQAGALSTAAAGTAATATTGKLAALGGGLKTAAAGMLAMVGGPLGILVGALGALGIAFLTSGEQAAAAGDKIARSMDSGVDAGIRAASDALTEVKISLADTAAWDFWGKNLRQVSAMTGVSFTKVVEAATKGKDAIAAITPELDRVARSKGFKDFEAFYNSGSTDVAGLVVLRNKLKQVADESTTTTDDLKATEEAATELGGAANGAAPSVEGLGDLIGETGEEAETAAEKIDKFIDGIFGMVDAAGNTQAALQGLGESLAESTDFTPNTEGGRANIDGFRDALKAAAQEQQWLIENTGKSTEQASADYIAFVQGLVDQMVAHGVDPTNIQVLADQAKAALAVGLESGEPAQLKVSGEQAKAEAANTATSVNNSMAGIEAGVQITADGSQAVNTAAGVEAYASSVARDYGATVSADPSNALENTNMAGGFMDDVVRAPREAQIGADTSVAILNLQNLASFAQTVLSAIQYGIGMIGTGINSKKNVSAEIGNVKVGGRQSAAGPAVPKVAAPVVPTTTAPVVAQPKTPAAPNFGALKDGYNKVKDAANKAGDAGKKAGNDMANGIDNATDAANDYANRLKQGLTSAFDKQYGVQKATDDYYSALNAINKKRDDELKQIDDLISKQKELNDEVAEQMVEARKAGIEKQISEKYGEVDRAADYAQQEQEALNAAEAKRKDIAANDAQIVSLRAGIGELNGYSEAAIANREALRNLESKMLDMVVAYANTGASVDQVRAYAANLTSQFQTDVAQMGYNQWAVGQLQGSLERYIGVVNAVPYHKPTTVTADVGTPTSDAMGAVNTFGAAADWAARPRTMSMTLDTSEATRQLRNIETQIRGGGTADDPSMTAFRPGTFARRAAGGPVPGLASGGLIPGKAPSNLSRDNLLAKVDGKGFIGVQSEEFIMQKRAVDFWGQDFMHAINNMKMPHFNAGGSIGGGKGSAGSGGPVLVELTAENLQAILRLAERDINLFADTEQLASSVNEGQRILASKGVS